MQLTLVWDPPGSPEAAAAESRRASCKLQCALIPRFGAWRPVVSMHRSELLRCRCDWQKNGRPPPNEPDDRDLPYSILHNLQCGLLDSGGEPDRLPGGAGDQGGSLVVDEQSTEWVGRSALALLPRRFPDHWSVESMMVRRLTRRLRTIKEAAPAAVRFPESLAARSSALCTALYERKKIAGRGAQRSLGGNF